MNAAAIWNDAWARLASGDALAFAVLAAVAALLAYPLVRLLMRRRWLRILMRVLFFGGVVALIAVAALMLSYYDPKAWPSVVALLFTGTFGPPVTWIFAAVVVATGFALRKPIAPRHRIRVSTVRHDEPAALPVEDTVTSEAAGPPLGLDPTPATPTPTPWRRAA